LQIVDSEGRDALPALHVATRGKLTFLSRNLAPQREIIIA